MDKVATARINNLRISEADFVPSSEQSITVSLADLRRIITEAVQKDIEPLQDEVMELKATVASQGEEIAALRSKLASLESLQEQDTTRICLDIAYDRRRLAALEKVEP
jgi:predicted RNase H-like nuclease (RuvC/YqgF family)